MVSAYTHSDSYFLQGKFMRTDRISNPGNLRISDSNKHKQEVEYKIPCNVVSIKGFTDGLSTRCASLRLGNAKSAKNLVKGTRRINKWVANKEE